MTAKHDLTGGGGGGVHAHIRRLAAPAAVGLFGQTLFNMTDTFYAGYISTAAQSALGFAFPPYFILLSFCIGIGQATTARTADALGAGRRARAACFIGQGAVLAGFVCLFVWLFLLPFAGEIVSLLGATGEEHRLATLYSSILYAGAPLFLAVFLLNGALQAVGNTRAFRNAVLLSVALNVLLDPMLMFGWFGLPALGLGGVAVATLLAQLFGILYLLRAFAGKAAASRWRWVFLRPRPPLLLRLAKQAIAPLGRMLCIGAGFFIITGFLGRFNADAVAAYGIALRVEQMFLLPTIGLEVALLAYAGQNFGAGQPRHVRAAYWLCLRYGMLLMGVSAAVLIFGGRFLIGAFNDSESVLAYGRGYLFAAAAVGPFYVFLNAAGAVLMGALRTIDIAVISVLRLVLLPLAFFWLFAVAAGLGVNGVWLGIFLANVAPAIWLHRRCLRTLAARGG